MKATAIILSGGKNSRMGCAKAFLEIGSKKIIERAIQQLPGLFNQIIIVSNEPSAYAYLGLEVVPDIIPDMGPLSGIHAGLNAARNHYSLVLACDMPFVEGKLASFLVQEAPGFDAVVPLVGQCLQPLFAVYSRDCLVPVTNLIKRRFLKVVDFYPYVRVKYVPQEKVAAVADIERVFLNVNTPADLEIARKYVTVSDKALMEG